MPLLSSRQLGEWEAFYLWRAGKIKPTPKDLSPEEFEKQMDKLLMKAG